MKEQISERAQIIQYSGIRKMVNMARGMEDVVSFAIGEPDGKTPENIKRAITKALEDGYTHYTPTNGLAELRDAIAQKLKRENGLTYDPGTEVLPTVGATEACFASIVSIVNPGDEVIITDPGFVFYAPTIILAGGKPVYSQIHEKNQFRMEAEDLKRLITPKTKAIWINSPHNPTGSVLTREDLEGIARLARDNDLLVISDEVYEKFVFDGFDHTSIASLPGMRERTITINALSKTYSMTGLRLGYVAADQKFIDRIHLVHMHMCTHPDSIIQKAGVEALLGPQDSVIDMVKEYKERKDLMIGRLNEVDGISCWNTRGSFYAFPDVKALGLSSFGLAEHLLKDGHVNTVPGSAFGDNEEGFLRVSFAAPKSAIEEGTERMKKSIGRLSK